MNGQFNTDLDLKYENVKSDLLSELEEISAANDKLTLLISPNC